MAVTFSGNTCKTTEVREGTTSNTVRTVLHCSGELNTVSHWTLDSSVAGVPDGRFVEEWTCVGKTMVVKDNGVDNQQLIEIDKQIQNHPVERIGETLREFMDNMKAING